MSFTFYFLVIYLIQASSVFKFLVFFPTLQYKSNVQCYYCKGYGHVKADCWKLKRKEKANYAEGEVEEKLFMAKEHIVNVATEVWYVDSGSSHHMSGEKSAFKELDESFKIEVKLGNDHEIKVEGRGTIAMSLHVH